MFASVDKALDERTIGHNPERLNLLKGGIIYSNKVGTGSASFTHSAFIGVGATAAMRAHDCTCCPAYEAPEGRLACDLIAALTMTSP